MDAKQIIDTLGGTTKVAEALNTSPQVVTNWKRRGIPPRVILENPLLFARALVAEEQTKHAPEAKESR